MYQKIKGFGPVMAVILISGAFIAPTAQATSITASEYPATITGTQTNENVFKAGGVRSISCSEAKLSGSLSGAEGTTKVTAAYGKCVSTPSSLSATIDMKSCSYTVTPGTPTGTTGNFTTTVDCSVVGDGIHFSVYASSSHITDEILCTYQVKPQGPLAAGEYHNIGFGTTSEIEYTTNITNTSMKVIKGIKILCGGFPGDTLNGTVTGNVKWTGFRLSHVGIMVGH